MYRVIRSVGSILCCLFFLALVTACAPAGGGGTASNPTTTATPPAPGSAALNGCPTQNPPTGVGTQPADVIVTQGGGTNSPPVMLKKGQTLEVRLPATYRWKMTIQDTGKILATTDATGWYDATLKACRWRFTALGPGTATLQYVGTLVCASGKPCPALAIAQDYTIQVQ
jgi:hypothetical protein